jgi:chromate transporter
MNLIVLYLLLLKAVATSFSGLGSLPVIRQDSIVNRQIINDRQLNAAVALGRVAPGPAGLYIVGVGYFAAGVPGAIVGLLALVTPSLLVILILRYLRQKAKHPRVKSVLQAVVLAGAGLLFSAIIPLGEASINSLWLLLLAVSDRVEGQRVISRCRQLANRHHQRKNFAHRQVEDRNIAVGGNLVAALFPVVFEGEPEFGQRLLILKELRFADAERAPELPRLLARVVGNLQHQADQSLRTLQSLLTLVCRHHADKLPDDEIREKNILNYQSG